MSEVRRKPKTGSSATASNPRPMWLWKPGGIPVLATSKKVPVGVTAFCYEHDTEWTPIDQQRPSNGPEPLPAAG